MSRGVHLFRGPAACTAILPGGLLNQPNGHHRTYPWCSFKLSGANTLKQKFASIVSAPQFSQGKNG